MTGAVETFDVCPDGAGPLESCPTLTGADGLTDAGDLRFKTESFERHVRVADLRPGRPARRPALPLCLAKDIYCARSDAPRAPWARQSRFADPWCVTHEVVRGDLRAAPRPVRVPCAKQG